MIWVKEADNKPRGHQQNRLPSKRKEKSRLPLLDFKTFLLIFQEHQLNGCPAKEGWSGVILVREMQINPSCFSAGTVLTGTSFSEITTTISKITFENSDSYYKPGIPFFGQVGEQRSEAS